jgi:hypothetical protein
VREILNQSLENKKNNGFTAGIPMVKELADKRKEGNKFIPLCINNII